MGCVEVSGTSDSVSAMAKIRCEVEYCDERSDLSKWIKWCET